MIEYKELVGKNTGEIIDILRKDGYRYDKYNGERWCNNRSVIGDPEPDNPLLLSGINPENYIVQIRLRKYDDELEEYLIIHVYNRSHIYYHDEDIICTKLFTSQLKNKSYGVGFVGDISSADGLVLTEKLSIKDISNK